MQEIILNHCQKIPELQAVYIFGSVADNTTHNDSDVDIAFLAKAPFDNVARWSLSQDIAIDLKKDVDLVDLQNCSEVLRFMVISKGKLIFNNAPQYLENFADNAYYLYMDLQELKSEQYLDIQKERSVYG